jgi:hypothetical protein
MISSFKFNGYNEKYKNKLPHHRPWPDFLFVRHFLLLFFLLSWWASSSLSLNLSLHIDLSLFEFVSVHRSLSLSLNLSQLGVTEWSWRVKILKKQREREIISEVGACDENKGPGICPCFVRLYQMRGKIQVIQMWFIIWLLLHSAA